MKREERTASAVDFGELSAGVSVALSETSIIGVRHSKIEDRAALLKCIVKNYDTTKANAQEKKTAINFIEEKEEVVIREVMAFFATCDDIEDALNELMPQSYSIFVSCFKNERERVFTDPDVDMFYAEFRECYPDFYTAFSKMGIPERNMENPASPSSKFFPAYTKAKEIINMKIEALSVKKALEGDNSAINSYIKMNDKRRKDGEVGENSKRVSSLSETEMKTSVFAEPPTIEKTRKDYSFNIEKPKDSPMYNPEVGLEADNVEVEQWVDPEPKQTEPARPRGRQPWVVKPMKELLEEIKARRMAKQNKAKERIERRKQFVV
jgi:hypothetical protein